MEYPFASLGPTLKVVTLVALFAFALMAIAVAILLAGLPGRIAVRRHHPQATAINICGWVGFLMLGVPWAIALVWAFLKPFGSTSVTGTADVASLTAQIDRMDAAVARLEQQRKEALS